MKVFHAQGWNGYSSWIPGRVVVTKLEDADLLVLEGGTDVNPALYGEKVGSRTERSDVARDKEETALFKKAVALGIPILGICRGSQLCCVMNHGRLVQDQSNPKYMHNVETSAGVIIPITSTHHQAQYVNDMEPSDYKLLAWTEGMSARHLDGDDKEISPVPFKEAEIVYYPKTRALGIQGHPESMSRKEYPATFAYLDTLMGKLLKNTL